MKQPLQMLERSVLVVAHPDDEVLWFSSVVKNVDHIVVCYLEIEGDPACSEGRRRALRNFPLKQISVLGIKEAGVFDLADWRRPKPTAAGMELRTTEAGLRRQAAYGRNYEELCNRLRQLLSGYQNVITHNPWGEYGHEEHVQVYRAVKDVQKQYGFDVWVSNYCSNRSFRLMESYIGGFWSDYVTVPADKEFAAEVRDLYRKNGCWTWYDDFQWFNEESFMLDDHMEYSVTGRGHMFPLNIIRMEWANDTQARPGRRIRALRFLARLLRLPEPATM